MMPPIWNRSKVFRRLISGWLWYFGHTGPAAIFACSAPSCLR
jgi:hypothetical protein